MKTFIRAVVILLTTSALCQAQVTFDNSASTSNFSVTTLTTPSFTITSNGNRVAIICLYTAAAVTSPSGSCGGVSATAITNASVTNTVQSQLFQVIAPPSGSQTCTMSWTGSQSASVSVITAYNVNQSTPTQNGNNGTGSGFATTASITITSANQNLTTTCGGDANTDTNITSNQTRETTGIYGSQDIGPGTGTTTHTWTAGGATNWVLTGVDLVKAAGGAAVVGTKTTKLRKLGL